MHRNTASRSFPVLFAIFLAACSESTLGSSDKAPTVSITSPLNDAAFDAIEPLSFCAQIEDEDDLGALQIVVQSNLAGTLWQTGDSEPVECAGGNFGISLALTAESQTIGISVVDQKGQGATAQVRVVPAVNAAPSCVISSPADGALFELADEVFFQAQAADSDSDPASLTATLESDFDGVLWSGNPDSSGNIEISDLDLSGQEHTLLLTVTDEHDSTARCGVDVTVNACPDADEDGVSVCDGDCDDEDPTSFPGGVEVADGADNDCNGEIDDQTELSDDDHDGTSEYEGDCDDTDATIYPGAFEIWYDGVDQDCDGQDDDQDGDGFLLADDCDDTDANVNPLQVEVWYDGTDQDCDGNDDDQDVDGYALADDCDDTNRNVNPGVAESWYDGIDQDCDGQDDDQDGDGYLRADDCDDTDTTVNPAMAEVWYDGVDQDCDGNDIDQDGDGVAYTVDCDDTDATINGGEAEIWYDGIDQDCDGNDTDQDEDGSDYTVDCDDTAATVYPGATEIWYDGIDQDCAGDDDFDQDADGYTRTDDCDDTVATRNPGEAEVWYDGIDQDCDGNDTDQDGDGYAYTVDCDDTVAAVNPGATEIWYDGVDDDCDGADDDQDEDGYLLVDDCDDEDDTLNPGEREIWYDGIDQDCDGNDMDQDEDGWDLADDCDDTNELMSPDLPEIRDGFDNDCDDWCDEGLVTAGELIVTEIMKDPTTVTDTNGEWFEVYNTSSITISMCGWTIADDDGESFVMSETVVVGPGDYAVFARNDSTAANDGVVADYEYGSDLQMGNSGDEVVLYNDVDLIDRVAYTTAFPNSAGYSLSLDPDHYNDTDNDTAANWCRGAGYYGAYNLGSPGTANPDCP